MHSHAIIIVLPVLAACGGYGEYSQEDAEIGERGIANGEQVAPGAPMADGEVARTIDQIDMQDDERNDAFYNWGYDASWERWDADDNQMLNYEEYQTGWNGLGVYDRWDGDNDGWLTEDEVGAGLFQDWDRDDDDVLTADEYRWGTRAWTDPAVPWGAYGVWDADSDGRVSQTEFTGAWSDFGLYDRWNTNAEDQLSEEELSRGVYTMWDTDGDQNVEVTEYRF